jgi:hypothetical protein
MHFWHTTPLDSVKDQVRSLRTARRPRKTLLTLKIIDNLSVEFVVFATFMLTKYFKILSLNFQTGHNYIQFGSNNFEIWTFLFLYDDGSIFHLMNLT